MIIDSYKDIFNDKQKVLFIFAHPDDAELFAGGTIARLVNDGKDVCVAKMTLGNKGSRQEKVTEKNLAAERETEDAESMEVLGIKKENNVYVGCKDGEVENNLAAIEKVVKLIRTFKPDLVVTHNPEDVIIRFDKNENWVNHRDHRNTGKSVIDACYPYSRDILFFNHQLDKKGVDSHTVTQYLLVDYYDHPDIVYLDVTETVDVKIKALAKHSSQYSLEKAKEATEFFTKQDDSERRYERFRYVVTD